MSGHFLHEFKKKRKENTFISKSIAFKFKKLFDVLVIFTIIFFISNAPFAIIGKY